MARSTVGFHSHVSNDAVVAALKKAGL